MHSHSYGTRTRAECGLRAAVVIISTAQRQYPTSAQMACHRKSNFFVSRQTKREKYNRLTESIFANIS